MCMSVTVSCDICSQYRKKRNFTWYVRNEIYCIYWFIMCVISSCTGFYIKYVGTNMTHKHVNGPYQNFLVNS